MDYAFTGALAVSFYGSPRTTRDVDVMVAIGDAGFEKKKVAEALRCASLKVDDREIDGALAAGYNIATFEDNLSPFSVDVILSKLKLDKRSGNIAGLETFIQQPEGLILAKLRMIKATIPRERALKDEDDIKSIITFTKVDIESVKERARRESTLDILNSLMN